MTTAEEILEEVKAMLLRNARRDAGNATRSIVAYAAEAQRDLERGHGSGSVARNIGSAVADLAAASAVIDLLTGGSQVNPHRTAAPPTADATGWTVRRDNIVYGEQVVSYTWHRWYWTAFLRAVLWILFHGLGRCSFRRGRWTADD